MCSYSRTRKYLYQSSALSQRYNYSSSTSLVISGKQKQNLPRACSLRYRSHLMRHHYKFNVIRFYNCNARLGLVCLSSSSITFDVIFKHGKMDNLYGKRTLIIGRTRSGKENVNHKIIILNKRLYFPFFFSKLLNS